MHSKISLFSVLSFLLFGFTTLDSIIRLHAEENTKPVVNEIRIANGNVKLFMRTAGGPTSENVLIGINGGPGLSSNYMRDLEKLAGEALTVVTYDQRGTGQSTEPAEGYGLAAYIEDLEAVRQAVGVRKVHLFGHSWGGIIAMHYAAVFPQNLQSIILMGSGPPTHKAKEAGQTEFNSRVASLQEQGLIPLAKPENTKNILELILPAYFSDPEFQVPPELQETHFNPEAYQHTLATLGNWDISTDAANITHPVLLLWGENDPFGLTMAKATKNALLHAQEVRFAVLKECGHFWHECPADFFDSMRDFLKLPSKSSRMQ